MEPCEESTTMASLTLKGLPDSLLKHLRRVAETNRRSLNREVIDRLERSLQGRRLDPVAFLARAEALRARLALKPLDDATIQKAKRDGRA
jgi:plasmid stability protein